MGSTGVTCRSAMATRAYLFARQEVEEAGFVREIDEYQTRSLAHCDTKLFMQEATWVILSAGMSEAVVRRVFPGICESFGRFEALSEIAANPHPFVERALRWFNHRPKLMGVVTAAIWVTTEGLEAIKSKLDNEGPRSLQRIPYIGPVTAFHLAKNLGVPVVKADRHLVRIAQALGFGSPTDLCGTVATWTGDAPQVVDLVFWRYATIRREYRTTLPASAAAS